MSKREETPVARKPRAIAIGFLFAFLLTTATIIYTGLLVKAPRTRSADVETPVDAQWLPAVGEENENPDERADTELGPGDTATAED